MKRRLNLIYQRLYSYFGPQHWWPAEGPFEVMVGAILTQNTSWQNVARAINNLKKEKLLKPDKLYHLPDKKLAAIIRPSGYYNIKAKRLKNFLNFFLGAYKADIRKLSAMDTGELRGELLSVNGIGQETADSILLYALGKPVFVIDSYTQRILSRHKLVKKDAGYETAQGLFMRNLKPDARMFNEYHALLVKLGKDFCLKSKPKCETCPLK